MTFKKVQVEDEKDPLFHVDQLKAFWEHEKNKDTTKGRLERPYITNKSSSDDEKNLLSWKKIFLEEVLRLVKVQMKAKKAA